MTWFRENRFLGSFLIVFGLGTIAAVWFLLAAKSDSDDAANRFTQDATELGRLQRLAPFPSAENVRKMKGFADDYTAAFGSLKEELKSRIFPVAPLAPNEFQARLRQAMLNISDKARANRVRLPDNFFLGFDEFGSALPDTAAAPLLGQELAQVGWLVGAMIDARVETVSMFRRKPAEERSASLASPAPAPAQRKPGTGGDDSKLIDRRLIETTFISSPGAARRVLNQIASANQQFYVIRLLRIRNEKEKGPPREVARENAGVAVPAPSPNAGLTTGAKPTPGTALNFIIGTERIETTATIELLKFTF